ncbi:MAG TPA: LAGLIDADG family homing endonuclease, partial [Candidatus Glassbacteria bacterium]|nr:LAGLIDADG family homing endonuclease [Candidatus Glassbacteria bacterium]
MLLKRAKIIIDANSIIDRDLLLFGPRRASFLKHDISENIVAAQNPIDVIAEIGNEDPDDWVVFRTRAIDAGGSDKTGEEYHGPNDNGDWFSEEELLAEDENGVKAFETFIGCPVFTNHKNDDVEQSRGRIVNSFYDKDQHCIYVDGLIDAKAYPELGRGVVKGYISDTSMGCSVKSSTCSICNNIAETEDQYCLVPGTKVTLGNKELRDIDEIEAGMEVLTHDGTSQKVKEIMERNIDEEIYEIYVSGSNIPLEITGNHPILRLPKMKYRETFDKYFENNFNPEFIESKNIEIGDYLLSPLYEKNNKQISSDLARLGGIYLAEGCIFRQRGKIQGVEFSISSEEIELRDNILTLCENITGKKAKCYKKGGNCFHIRICDEKLAEDFLNIFGEYSRKKYIGSDVFTWNEEQIIEFLGGYIDGDGYIYNNENLYIRTSSKNITLQIQKLLSSIGSWASIHNHDQIDNDLVTYKDNSEKDTNLISISNIGSQKIFTQNSIKIRNLNNVSLRDTSSHWVKNNYDIVKVRKIAKKEYNGPVFNLSIEKNENYIANNIIVHNCSHIKNHKGKKISGNRVYEKNHAIKFIENSFVTDGACLNCTVQNAYTGSELIEKLKKVVSAGNDDLVYMRKVASLNKNARG